MRKRLPILALLLALLAGCTATPTARNGAGSHPPSYDVTGTYLGLTEQGWVRIRLPDNATVLELEIQTEVKPSFEAMKLKAGELVSVTVYKGAAKLAGIFRANQ